MSIKKIKYEDFDLRSVKWTGKRLTAKWWDTEDGNREYNAGSNDLPHPDLMNPLMSLQQYAAKIFALTAGWDYSRDNLRENLEGLEGAVKGFNEIVDRTKISGIVFVGTDKHEGLKITGQHKTLLGMSGFTTPALRFQETTMGFEKEVEDIAEEIRKQTFRYIFDNVKAQQDIVTQSEKAEKKIKNQPSLIPEEEQA